MAADIAETASIVGSVSAFLDVLAGVGLVVGLIAGILEIFEGAEQYVVSLASCTILHRREPVTRC